MTQVTLNQHAGVLLLQRFCPLESVEEKMGVEGVRWSRVVGPDGRRMADDVDAV